VTAYLLVPLAGFLGSFHCAAMCGPFVGFYTMAGSGHRGLRHLAYHLGRLTAYLSLGLVVGWVGQGLLYASAYLQVQKALVLLLGGSMIAIGIAHYFPQHLKDRLGLGYIHRHLVRMIGRTPSAKGAGLLGLLSTCLPCGFLYSFAFAAGASGSPGTSALIMLGFWSGTLPMLLGIGFMAGRINQKTARRLSSLTPAFLVFFGVLALIGKWQAFPDLALTSDQWCPVLF